jgi:hypothetical protein
MSTKFISVLTALLTCMLAPGLSAANKEYVIAAVDPKAGSVTLKSERDLKTYQLTATAVVTVNGMPNSILLLTPGMKASVALSDSKTIARIAATGLQKVNATQSLEATIEATASPQSPTKITTVAAGQLVSITGLRGSWSGGGSRKGISCDWKGYPDSDVHWMALCARIGAQVFTFSKDILEFLAPANGVLELYAQDDNPKGNTGRVAVKVQVTTPTKK